MLPLQIDRHEETRIKKIMSDSDTGTVVLYPLHLKGGATAMTEVSLIKKE